MLDGLADEGGDTAAAHEASDQLRVAYGRDVRRRRGVRALDHPAPSAVRPPPRPAARPRREPAGSRRSCGGRPGAARRPRHRAAGRAPQPPQGPRAGSAEDARGPHARGHRLPRGAARLRRHVALGARRAGWSPGLTCVFRVRNEARNLPWVLPPILAAVQHVLAGRQRLRRRHRRASPRAIAADLRCRATGFTGLTYPHGVAARRRRAPGHPRHVGPLADALLQLVLQPRPDGVLDEVGRRHGADAGGRRHPARPGLAAGVDPRRSWPCRGTR